MVHISDRRPSVLGLVPLLLQAYAEEVLQTKPRPVDSACELLTALRNKRTPYIMPLYVSEAKLNS